VGTEHVPGATRYQRDYDKCDCPMSFHRREIKRAYLKRA
jgi:hypothetical protein